MESSLRIGATVSIPYWSVDARGVPPASRENERNTPAGLLRTTAAPLARLIQRAQCPSHGP